MTRYINLQEIPNYLIMVQLGPDPKYTKIWALKQVGRGYNKQTYRLFWGILGGKMQSQLFYATRTRDRRNLRVKIQNKINGGYQQLESQDLIFPAVHDQIDQQILWLTLTDQLK